MRSRAPGTWWGNAIEAPDPRALAHFYSDLLGWPVGHEEPGTAILAAAQEGPYLVFQQVAADWVPPVWPSVTGAQRAVALGATLAEHQPQDHVRVLLDPAGHPFCLCRDDG